MTIADKLLQGSYKGVRFLATSFPTSGGRKIIKHSFLNSDKQNIEDFGLMPRSYSMTIIITGDENNYISNRDAFLRVIEDGEAGKLVHPLYGDIENIKVGLFTLSETLTELGEARFTITFELSEGTGIPERATNSLSIIESSNSEVVAAIGANVADNYESSTKFPNSYTESLNKLNGIGSSLESATNIVQAASDKIDSFNSELQAFTNDVTNLVRDSDSLSTSITSLFDTIDNLYTDSSDTLIALAGLFDFGDDDVILNPTTASRLERAKNQKIINDTLQAMALSYSYFNASRLVFATVDEIDTQASILESQYKKVSASTGINDDVKQSLRDMRVNVQQFFEEQKLVTQQIITIDTEQTSARLLAYQYYGSSDQGEQISELNESSEPSFLEGSIKVLSA